MADNEISRKIEDAEKLISEGKKVDTRKLVREINEEIILRVMVEEALEEYGAPGHLIPLPVSPISIELGRGLLSLLDPKEGAKLKDQCTSVRCHVAMEFGFVPPGVKFRANLWLKPNCYVIKIREIEAVTREAMVNHLLAIAPEDRLMKLPGDITVDPIFDMPGKWIAQNLRSEAEKRGCIVFDPVSVIATQLTEVVRTHAVDLLGCNEVQDLIDTVEKTHPAVVKNLVPDRISLREVQKVLQNLLREKVSVRDLVTILETIADNVHMSRDPEVLTESVRVALSMAICREYMNNEGVINVITIDPQLEKIVTQAILRTERGTCLAFDPDMGTEILMAFGQEVEKMQKLSLQPIIFCAPQIRLALKRLTDRGFPNLVVLSWNEIAPNVNVNSVGMVSISDSIKQAEEEEKSDRCPYFKACVMADDEIGNKIDEALEEHGTPEQLILTPVSPISIEVGRGLLSLVDPKEGAKLRERCSSIRRHVALELGVVVPVVRFRDNLQLKPNAYVMKIKEIEVATGEVMVNQFLAIGPEDKLNRLRGTRTVDPTYGMAGIWISPEQRGDAERLGCMIFDPVSVIATQLTEVERTHVADLLGCQEVQNLIDNIEKTHPAVVKGLVPDRISLGEVQRVLQNLVRERVSVRDLVTVLETIADNVDMSKDPEVLTECVRVALSRVICKEYMNNEGVINVITIDPHLEQIVAKAIQKTEMGTFIALDPSTGQEILMSIGQEVGKLQERGLQPIILCAPQIRPALKRLAERSFPNLVVLSWNEIAPKVNVNAVGTVSVDNLKIDVLTLEIRLEKWLASFIIYNNNEYDMKLDEAAEEIFIKAIDKEFGKLESSKDSRIILCSPIISRGIRGAVWGSLLMETLKERFPKISFCVRDESMGPSTRYNIVGTVSLGEYLTSAGTSETVAAH